MWLKRKFKKYFSKKKRVLRVLDVEQKLASIKNLFFTSPSSLMNSQLNNPLTIPVIIINYNQLFYLQKLIDFLISREVKNIIIIDNNSNYSPLIEYYDSIKTRVKVLKQNENLGHLVLWKERKIFKKYCKGFYVLTDADIVPNEKLDSDFLNRMLDVLIRYPEKTKVGFALKIDDIPDSYSLKEKVITWESKFWENPIENDLYDADIDTTFALYWPKTDRIINELYPSFFSAIRMGGDFVATHGGWYVDYKNLSEEQENYFKTSNNSNSWKINENGDLQGDFVNDY